MLLATNLYKILYGYDQSPLRSINFNFIVSKFKFLILLFNLKFFKGYPSNFDIKGIIWKFRTRGTKQKKVWPFLIS
jgi:hypothetical protein